MWKEFGRWVDHFVQRQLTSPEERDVLERDLARQDLSESKVIREAIEAANSVPLGVDAFDAMERFRWYQRQIDHNRIDESNNKPPV